jgi:predicted TIM-barrel fold metal-dependent hydrolase
MKEGDEVMPVIDVDCHFDLTIRPEDHPLKEWADRLPKLEHFIADALTGDLLRSTPDDARPDENALAMYLPDSNRSSAEQSTAPGQFEPRFPQATAAERIGWFDKVGIDYALMNPGGWGFLVDYMGEDKAEAVRRSNDYMADHLDDESGRMIQVSLIDWDDLTGAAAELERMRARGSRAFWLRTEPSRGVSPAHADWDRVWSAATDLGMVAILHIGNTPSHFEGGWGNVQWDMPGGTGLGGFFRFANSLRHQPAEMMLAAMTYGGVFGRHPNLTVITEELGVAWLPYFITRCDALGAAGPWAFETTPGEMVRRNVRATPLLGLGDPNVAEGLLQQFPDTFVFSSDYPHGEGNPDPLNLYEPALSLLDESLRASFLGGNMADCFARMGDPLSER